jgi:hypothetical protein
VATKLESELHREIVVPGVDGPVIVALSKEGLAFPLKGSRSPVKADWIRLIKACDCERWLFADGYQVLQYAAAKRNVSKAAR